MCLLGLRIFETVGADIDDLGEEHGHRVLRVRGRGGVRLPRMHPHMLRRTFGTTMLGAGVDLRHVQIAARHADARTTMRDDRACKNLDRHPNDILAAVMVSGT